MKASSFRHLSISCKTVRRKRGDSFPRQVAYCGRDFAIHPHTKRRFDFSSRGSAEATGLVGWCGTLEELAADAVVAERRWDAVEGRVMILALPSEFDDQMRRSVTQECAIHLSNRFGVAAFWTVHTPPEDGDARNGHAHVLLTSRRVIGGKTLGEKTKELDSFLTGPQAIEEFRAWWCGLLNRRLEEAGFEPNVEHRSYRRLGVRVTPSQHQGEKRTAMRRRKAREVGSSVSQPTPKVPRPRMMPLPEPHCPSTDLPTQRRAPSGLRKLPIPSAQAHLAEGPHGGDQAPHGP